MSIEHRGGLVIDRGAVPLHDLLDFLDLVFAVTAGRNQRVALLLAFGLEAAALLELLLFGLFGAKGFDLLLGVDVSERLSAIGILFLDELGDSLAGLRIVREFIEQPGQVGHCGRIKLDGRFCHRVSSIGGAGVRGNVVPAPVRREGRMN